MLNNVQFKRSVEAALEGESSLDATGIGVATHDGVVTLTGFVRSFAQRVKAVDVVKRVAAVRAIANELEVRPDGVHQHNDTEIAESAIQVLRRDGTMPEAPTLPGGAMINLNETRHHANSVVVFRDRLEVGRLLAEQLAPYHGPGIVVVGIARGGVPVAGEIARRLEAELDVVVVRKLGAPGFRHVGIGAVTADGTRILNHDVIRALKVSETYVDAVTSVQQREAAWIEQRVRDLWPAAEVANRVVILVDDGASTGATVRVAAQSLRRHRPARLIAALPVASPTARAAFQEDFDQLVCLHQPEVFDAIADYYQYFEPVEDVQVRRTLEESRATAEAAVV